MREVWDGEDTILLLLLDLLVAFHIGDDNILLGFTEFIELLFYFDYIHSQAPLERIGFINLRNKDLVCRGRSFV